RVRRTRMQRVERRADDAIAETREPSGAPGALLVHVEAEHFDEEHLGELREDAGPAGTRAARFGECVADRSLQPNAGVRSADADLEQRGKTREQHFREPRIAREIAADEARPRSAAAISENAGAARQH